MQASAACTKQKPNSLQIPSTVSQSFTKSNQATYEETVADIAKKRQRLKAEYLSVSSQGEKAHVLAQTQELLVDAVGTKLAPFWYGTVWDFNGTSQEPGKGSIACGYFVSTLLLHAGLEVQRVSMAQQASELIIKSLVSEKYIKRYSNRSLRDFVDSIKEWGPGLYIVGLDFHVGFIVYNKQGVYFVHSTYVHPQMVLNEKAIDSVVLQSSKYRVLGKLSEDDSLLIKWLMEKAIVTRKS